VSFYSSSASSRDGRSDSDSECDRRSQEAQKKTKTGNGKNYAFFGVFDGHGGKDAADFVRKHLYKNIVEQSSFKTSVTTAIEHGFATTESDFSSKVKTEKINGAVGTTACVAIFVENERTHKREMFIANLGDSAAVLCRAGEPILLTIQHSLKNPAEKERIEKLGGKIHGERLGHPVWNPDLISIAVTRAIGDTYFKDRTWVDDKSSGLIAVPEVVRVELSPRDQFVVIASDGLWDVISPAEVVEFVQQYDWVDLNQICKDLVDLALRRKTMDNTTVVLIKLNLREKAINVGHSDSSSTDGQRKSSPSS